MFGGDGRIRTYSPERTDLQSAAALQLSRIPMTLFPMVLDAADAANEECVVKHTIVGFTPTYRAVDAGSYVQCTKLDHTVCFTTLPFYTFQLPPGTYHPVGRPH